MQTEAQKKWEEYRERELRGATTLLSELGFSLDPQQVHIAGERYLMSGRKLVLTGIRLSDKKRVVIKISSDSEGAREISHEHQRRETLKGLRFAYYALPSPEELLYEKRSGYTLLVTAYIPQEKNFLDRPLREQFSLLLAALKIQEGMHATAYAHARAIRTAFEVWGAHDYIDSFYRMGQSMKGQNQALDHALERAHKVLKQNQNTLEQYCGFLTHADFVPHNVRVVNDTLYLIDQTSLHFGNKYESWARLLNFMLLYNRPLEQALLHYVRDNRTPEEYLSLRLMRIYKVTFLLCFYSENLEKTSDNLHELTLARIAFWLKALNSLIEDVPLSDEGIAAYKALRDRLRSPEEKQRQRELH